ncbi:unnamed protein product [Lactuca saligna]|uniref:Uncharacterized protein n=1 Tax=Lactuca saligna TaxID=75948 RepID=A0AA35ZSV5_LACSI|nr:unnamed protein product [Lactuca saligna]
MSVSVGQYQRARATAIEMIEGKLEDHYTKVWDYAVAIRDFYKLWQTYSSMLSIYNVVEVEAEEEEVEGEVGEMEAEEEQVKEREVGARVVPLDPGSYNILWEKKRIPSERIRKLKLKKVVQDANGGGSTKTPWVLD